MNLNNNMDMNNNNNNNMDLNGNGSYDFNSGYEAAAGKLETWPHSNCCPSSYVNLNELQFLTYSR